jgi:hypothetical protein
MRNIFIFAVLMIFINYAFAFQGEGFTSNDFTDYYLVVVTILLTISEALAMIPGLRSNSILQLIINILRAMKRK